MVGARPQFIKAAAIAWALEAHRAATGSGRRTIEALWIHTGQHYDWEMSAAFFGELDLVEPHHNLGIGSDSHAAQTANMLVGLESLLKEEAVDAVVVFGDTNTTLAGALAAAKLNMPVAHVEAGLRCHNRRMPEEINRVITDRLATMLFCPSPQAVRNLHEEGIVEGVSETGDVMYEVFGARLPSAVASRYAAAHLGLEPGSYALATVHRQENTDDQTQLSAILAGLGAVAREIPLVMPLHPRTKKAIPRDWQSEGDLRFIPPLPYVEMLSLQATSRVIFTDSGGLQKESYWLGIPCVTLRDETEWIETLSDGWNQLVGSDPHRILDAFVNAPDARSHQSLYGGTASASIVSRLVQIVARKVR